MRSGGWSNFAALQKNKEKRQRKREEAKGKKSS
jgi:hypothetical protein